MREIEELKRLDPERKAFDLNEVISAMRAIGEKDKRYRVSFVTFLSKEDPLGLFQGWNSVGFSASYHHETGFVRARLRRTIRRASIEGGERDVHGEFGLFKNRHPGVWTAFTSDSADFFKSGLMTYLRSYRPDISQIFISSEEMRAMFDRLASDLRCEITAERAVIYTRQAGTITFEKQPYQSLFNEAENKDGYVDKIEFSLLTPRLKEGGSRQLILNGFLSREGVSYFYRGQAGHLVNKLIPIVADLGSIKRQLFSDRERTLGELVLRPIDVVYTKDVFQGPADNDRLIEGLAMLDRAAITVYHRNPYLHVSLLDFVDGSCFDIYAGSSDRLTIVPNFIASVHSLMRVSEQIDRYFGEGTLKEFEEREAGLEEFLGA